MNLERSVYLNYATDLHYNTQERKHYKREAIIKELKIAYAKGIDINNALYKELGNKYEYSKENIIRIWQRYNATEYISITNKGAYTKGIVTRNPDALKRQTDKVTEWRKAHNYPKKELVTVEDYDASRKIIAEIIYLRYCRFIPTKVISEEMKMSFTQLNWLCAKFLQYRCISARNRSTHETIMFFQPNISQNIEMTVLMKYMKEKLAIYKISYKKGTYHRYKHYVTSQIAKGNKNEMGKAYRGILKAISEYLTVDELNAIDIKYAIKNID